MARALILFCLLFFAPHATASSEAIEQMQGWLDAGAYERVIAVDSGALTPEGGRIKRDAMSARLILGQSDDPVGDAKQLRDWADDVLAEDPANRMALIHRALAYGLESRSSGNFRVWINNLPDKTREAIQDVLDQYPDDPQAQALLGAWHLTIVRRLGDSAAARIFDASVWAGRDHYKAAFDARPNDLVITSNYAMSLLAIDPDKYAARGSYLLGQVADAEAKHALDTLLIERARILLDLSDNREAQRKQAAAYLDGDA